MLSSEAAAEGMQKAVPIAKLTASPLVCTPDGARRHGGSQPGSMTQGHCMQLAAKVRQWCGCFWSAGGCGFLY